MRVSPGQLMPRRRPTPESRPRDPSEAPSSARPTRPTTAGDQAKNAREQLARARQHLEHARARLARTRDKEPPREE